MPALRQASKRTLIGASNRSTASLGSSVSTEPRAPRSPYMARPPNVIQPELYPSSSVVELQTSQQEPRRKGPGDLPPSRSREGYLDYRERLTRSGARIFGTDGSGSGPNSVSTMGTSSVGTASDTLSGHQEYALQTMIDFFSNRPLDQMRNAFRNADRDGSGQLDMKEFCKAVRNMGSKLTDKDAKVLFLIADQDNSGTLGIDEFFVNFRHDRFPREKFFWSKQCGGGENLSKDQRKALASTVDYEQQPPVKMSTAKIMEILEKKVAAHGSAQTIFTNLNTDNNESLEVNEIADAIRPYMIDIDDAQAADVLAQINKIVGKPPDAPLNYNSFATAFNSHLPPKQMGSIAFQPPAPNELVRRRLPIDHEPPTLDATRNLERTQSSMETYDHIKSISTLPPAPPIDHTPWRAPKSDVERKKEQESAPKYDQMSGWRGINGNMMDEGDELGKRIMKTGADIDWYADNQEKTRGQKMYASATHIEVENAADGGVQLRTSQRRLPVRENTKSTPNLTPLERPSSGSSHLQISAVAAEGVSSHGEPEAMPRVLRAASAGPSPSVVSMTDSQKLAHWAEDTQASMNKSLSRSASASSMSLNRTRSKLSLALEAAGSKSTADCLRPGVSSHHHIEETTRLSQTSSIASLRSVSGFNRPMQDPRIIEQREWKKIKVQELGERIAARDDFLNDKRERIDRRAEMVANERAKRQANHTKRTGSIS